MLIRKLKKAFVSIPAMEGAGVALHRAVGYYDTALFDPFLLLDDFRSDVPDDYVRGFPWHPHRGIETVTYMLKGRVEHRDSMGNKGIISGGDVQWMTAGSGIIHQEMPMGDDDGKMYGFQLWVNLSSSDKMMKPRYRDVRNDMIPAAGNGGMEARIICGEYLGVKGPVDDITTFPEYFDIAMPDNAQIEIPSPQGHTVFLYVTDGHIILEDSGKMKFGNRSVLLFEDGEFVRIMTGDEPAGFLYFSGKPLGEPVAWRGPIVMNTDEELKTAYRELENGTFIKK